MKSFRRKRRMTIKKESRVNRTIYEAEHEAFRQTFRAWLEREVKPHDGEWNEAGIVPRELFTKAGKHGFLTFEVPEELGGAGVDDFRYNAVCIEEVGRLALASTMAGIGLQNDIIVPYFLRYTTPEQARRWLPGIASGSTITAIAMTEPGFGSDLASMTTTAIRDGDRYLVNGSKIFISNGINADLVIVAVKTDPGQRHAGMSLLVLERGMEGFERGRKLDKLGMHSQDTAELFFNDVSVPVRNLLGEEGQGFNMLVSNLPRERLTIALATVAGARATLALTLDYVKQRRAFGQTIGSFQNTRFVLAEVATEIDIAQSYVDNCVVALNSGDLTGEEAAKAKWWCSEMQFRNISRCLQFFGGYGYMMEYPVARAFADARVAMIYGGTTEIMKEIVGRSMGL